MNKILMTVLLFAANLFSEINLNENVADEYSPYSYKGRCSYLNDPGCSGRVFNPTTGGTTYVGDRPVSNSDNYYRYKNGNWKRKRNGFGRKERRHRRNR